MQQQILRVANGSLSEIAEAMSAKPWARQPALNIK